jgi:hypothetical protein
VLEFIPASPELQPNRITKDEVKNKSQVEFGQNIDHLPMPKNVLPEG